MKKEAVITIKGDQAYDHLNDDIELTTIGTIDEDDEKYILEYDEELEPPKPPIHVTVHISKDKKFAQIMRSGGNSACLVIEKETRNLCTYGTEYGDILMGIYGSTIESAIFEDAGRIILKYDIDINGVIASTNKTVINFNLSESLSKNKELYECLGTIEL